MKGVFICLPKFGHRTKILKADVSSVSPSPERIEELWVTCSFIVE